MRPIPTALAWVALLGSTPAPAAPSSLLTMFDRNGDGCVDVAEYRAYMDDGFRRMDADGNGILDAGELPAGNAHRAPLTLQQHHRHVERQFHRQDTNHDGCLDLHELMAPPR